MSLNLSFIDWSDTEFSDSEYDNITPEIVKVKMETDPSSSNDVIEPPKVDWKCCTNTPEVLRCISIDSDAILPTRGTPNSAGLDLYSTIDVFIPPHRRVRIPTGLLAAIPDNHFGQICDKSSVAWKSGLHVIAGIIDADYRGEIFVVLHNLSSVSKFVAKGNSIAQIVIQEYKKVKVEWFSDLSTTQRGTGGFGSTSK